MNKFLLLAALCLGTAANTSAQTTTIYSQNFEGPLETIFNEGWTFMKTVGPEQNFGVFNAVPEIQEIGFSGKTIGATTYNTVNLTAVHVPGTDVMIVSPVINIPMADVVLSYKAGSMSIDEGSSSHYSVYIVTVAEMASATTPTQLSGLLNNKMAEDEATVAGESVTTSYNLPDYAGQAVRVVFRLHNSPTNAALLFDDVIVTQQGALGTEDIVAENAFAVYPNPATDIVTLQGANGLAFDTVTITDMNGRIVATQQLNCTGGGQVNISSLNSGMYIITATSDRGTATKKIVKQ